MRFACSDYVVNTECLIPWDDQIMFYIL